MLDLDEKRQGAPPRDASTLVVVRDASAAAGASAAPASVEVFCVERHTKSGFLGGAIVFPGGKLDASDLEPAWDAQTTAIRATSTPLAADERTERGLAIAACREAFEEAAILPIVGAGPTHAELLSWRSDLLAGFGGSGFAGAGASPDPGALRALLAARGHRLDLGSLRPFARWVTPTSEARRFDTRFYLFVAGRALEGKHDDLETTASFWARPALVLERFAAGKLQLAPPTHRVLQLLGEARDTVEAIVMTETACLDPVCPEFVPHRDAGGDTMALVLPGDPEHSVAAVRVRGPSRFVLRGGRFLPEDAPR